MSTSSRDGQELAVKGLRRPRNRGSAMVQQATGQRLSSLPGAQWLAYGRDTHGKLQQYSSTTPGRVPKTRYLASERAGKARTRPTHAR